MQKEIASRLLELLDRGSFSPETLEQLENKSADIARSFSQDSEEQALLALIGLAASQIAVRIRGSDDPRFHRFLESQLAEALRTAISSLDLAQAHKLIVAIMAMPKAFNA